MRRCAALVARVSLAVSVGACAHGAAPPAARESREDPLARLSPPIRAVFRDVARVRGLDLRRRVDVHELSGSEFERRALSGQGMTTQTALADGAGGALFEAFGIALPSDTRASGDKLTRESLAGYYSSDQRALFVRSDAPTAARDEPDEVFDTLTHEIVHAVQDDSFPLSALGRIERPDAHLAALAVYEGDATVSAWAVAAERARLPLADTIRLKSTIGLVSGVASQALLHLYAPELEIASVPALVRDRLTFPYWAGAYFVAEVHRTGGFALVNRVFGRLPDTTEQVLHPEKYFAAEGALDIDVPSAPPGYSIASTGSLGELQMRSLLSEWVPAEEAIGAASGWGGDRYTIVRAPGRPLGVVWITAWDDEKSAARFERAAARSQGCAGRSPRCREGPLRVSRANRRVVYVRGVEVTEAMMAKLFATPEHARTIAPALKGVDYDQHDENSPFERERDARATYRDTGLGIQMQIPPGLERIKSADTLLSVRGTPGVSALGLMRRGGEPLDDKLLAALRASIGPMLAMNAGATDVSIEAEGERTLLIGRARTMAWRVGVGLGRARVTVVPICGGADTLMIVEFSFNEEARVALDRWVSSMEPLRGGPAKTCGRSPAH
jgi:hypothetical protein